MARVCQLCQKGTVRQGSGVHQHGGMWARRGPVSRRKWKPNLRTVRIEVKGQMRKMRLCAKCLKSAKVETKVEEK